MIKNTDYIKANAFAFYSINGNNCIDFKDSSKAESVCEFLEKIVEENKGKSIVLILDNSIEHLSPSLPILRSVELFLRFPHYFCREIKKNVQDL